MCLRSRRGFRRDEHSSYEVGALFEQLVFKLRGVQGDRINRRMRGVGNESGSKAYVYASLPSNVKKALRQNPSAFYYA